MTLWLRLVLSGLAVFVLQSCGGGGGGGSCSLGSGTNVIISGGVTFDRVPHKANGGLDYNNIDQLAPVRGAVVEAVCNSSAISSTTTDSVGHYSLNVPGNTKGVLVRVKAQMLKSGTPSWNFRVVNNTAGKALYVMDSSAFNTEITDLALDLHAASGWGGSSYTSARVAAPFAILDSVYVAFQKILLAEPNAIFPALNLNWSVNNVPVSGDPAIGQIQTSHFNNTEIYILGAANDDADEYDDHVIIHEWGHYFEHNFSRADNIGGDHATGNILDIRVAFGEGFGNAWSAIASDDPIYVDSYGPSQFTGLRMDIENNSCANAGWYSECSVQSVLYDLYDAVNDGNDAITMGFSPLYSVLVNEQKNTPAMTSIFSFIHALKQNNSGNSAAINSLLSGQNIDSVTDAYGGTQFTNFSGSSDALPVYKTIVPGGGAVNVCSSDEFQIGNGYEVFRFLKLSLLTMQSVSIVATRSGGTGTGHDPDLALYRNGSIAGYAGAYTQNTETLSINNLVAGDYVLELVDYGNQLPNTGAGNTCYNISM